MAAGEQRSGNFRYKVLSDGTVEITKYPDLCRRVDKQKYPDYAEYEIQKDRVSIRLLPPMSEEKRKVASEKAKAAGLGTRNIT